MRRICIYASVMALSLVWCASESSAQTQNVPTRTLAQPEVELAEPFTRLMGVRELADGRLIVSDQTEKFIAIVDLTKRSYTKIGSVGQGPGEYTLPGAIVALPGDTTLVSDMLGRKYLKITPAGTFAGDVTMPSPSRVAGPGGGFMMFGGAASSADANGRLYSLGSSMKLAPDGQMTPTDSAPITRIDLRSSRTDTLSFIKVRPVQIQTSDRAGGGRSVDVRVGGGNVPFVVQQAWTAAPDGRVAVVTPEPYRVTWISATGQKTVGEPIPFERVRVTESEKSAYRESQRTSPRTGIAVEVGGRGGTQSVQQVPITFREPDSWPEFKHPFQEAVLVAPTGELWVMKQLSAAQKNPTYDIIGARGELLSRVVVPQRTRLLGFGRNGTVYLVRRDADDLEYIQRHRITQSR